MMLQPKGHHKLLSNYILLLVSPYSRLMRPAVRSEDLEEEDRPSRFKTYNKELQKQFTNPEYFLKMPWSTLKQLKYEYKEQSIIEIQKIKKISFSKCKSKIVLSRLLIEDSIKLFPQVIDLANSQATTNDIMAKLGEVFPIVDSLD